MNEDALERLIEDTRKRMMLLTQRYGDEEITFAEWRTLFELEIRLLHMMAWALTFGQDAARRAPEVEQIIASEMRYFISWANAIDPPTRFNTAVAVARAALYAGAGRSTAWQAYTWSLGMPRLPCYPGEGCTQCGRNCKCRLDIEQVPGGYDVRWLLGPGAIEHCPDCIRNTLEWNPLKIRNGVILR